MNDNNSFPQQVERIQKELSRLRDVDDSLDALEHTVTVQERERLVEHLEERLFGLAQFASEEEIFDRLPYPETGTAPIPQKVLDNHPDTRFRVIGGKDIPEKSSGTSSQSHVVLLGNEGQVWTLKDVKRFSPMRHQHGKRVEASGEDSQYWTDQLAQDTYVNLTHHYRWISSLLGGAGEITPFQAETFWEEGDREPLEGVIEVVEELEEGIQQARRELHEELQARTERLEERRERLQDTNGTFPARS